MKDIRLITILLIFAVFIGAFLIFTFGSPAFSGQVTEPIFSVRIIDFESPVLVGKFMEFSYATRSVSDVDGAANIYFWIEKGGEVITSGHDVIFLGNFEERTRTAKIFLPSNFESGVYDLNIEVDYQGYTANSQRTIEMNVKGGLATVTAGIGKSNLIIVSLLILFAVLNIYLIYRLEKSKIKKALGKEEQFIKGHKASIFTITFFLILGVLVYYLSRINFLPGIPLYWYYSILVVLLLVVLFFVRNKKHTSK
ncbi:MAG: hypothetical protein Q8P79_01670 [Nanoarchaeota archaeon]|nr:hypothetical protein [Nanoarchaeota archaeon]